MQEKANTPLKQGFQLGKKNSPTGNIFFLSWALFSAQLRFIYIIAFETVSVRCNIL